MGDDNKGKIIGEPEFLLDDSVSELELEGEPGRGDPETSPDELDLDDLSESPFPDTPEEGFAAHAQPQQPLHQQTFETQQPPYAPPQQPHTGPGPFPEGADHTQPPLQQPHAGPFPEGADHTQPPLQQPHAGPFPEGADHTQPPLQQPHTGPGPFPEGADHAQPPSPDQHMEWGNLDLTGTQAEQSGIPQQAPGERSPGELYTDLPQEQVQRGGLELAAEPQPANRDGTLFDGAAVPTLEVDDAAGPAGPATVYEGPVPGAEAEPGAEPSDKPRLTSHKEMLKSIDKAIKTLNLYEGRGEAAQAPVDLAFMQVSEVLSHFGTITLKITPFEFLLDDQPVYTSEEERRGMTYRLFRDGLRELTILPGILRDEFSELIEIMRAIQPYSSEDDSITLLWEKNLPAVRYKAVDLFLEGLVVGELEEYQSQVDDLVREVNRPLHGGGGQITAAQEVRTRLSADVVEQSRAQVYQLLSALVASAPEGRLDAILQQHLPEVPEDLWRRAMGILLRLMEVGKSQYVAGVLVKVIEQTMLQGRWKMLALACQFVRKLHEQSRGQGPAIEALTSSMEHLVGRNKLLDLEPLLFECAYSDFLLLKNLIDILPPSASPQLVALLARLSPGEVQDDLLKILKERRADLSDFYRQRLTSPNVMHVVYAIHDLRTLKTARSYDAIRSVAHHPNPKVRYEAFRALGEGEQIDQRLVSTLISSLSLEHRELREMAIALLARMPARQHLPKLVQITKADEFEDWGPEHRRHLMALIVRWGGAESNEFVIRTVTSSNPLRRKKVDVMREDMLEVLKRIGGNRAMSLLKACLSTRTSKPIRVMIEEAVGAVHARKK